MTAVRLGRDGVTAHTFLDRRALVNAMAAIAATPGSTNGVLQLVAIAREAGVPLTLHELADVARRTCTASAGRGPSSASSCAAPLHALRNGDCAAVDDPGLLTTPM